jgi:hypothetical protein
MLAHTGISRRRSRAAPGAAVARSAAAPALMMAVQIMNTAAYGKFTRQELFLTPRFPSLLQKHLIRDEIH